MGFIIPTCKETLTNTIFLSTLKKGAKKKFERKKVESFPPKKKQIWCVHETCKIIFVEIFTRNTKLCNMYGMVGM